MFLVSLPVPELNFVNRRSSLQQLSLSIRIYLFIFLDPITAIPNLAILFPQFPELAYHSSRGSALSDLNRVLKAWNVLARRQISTQLIEIESRPHITLFSSPFVDVSKLESIVKNFASKQEPLALSFSSIGSLANDQNVLFLTPTPSLSLIQFHLQLCDTMRKDGIEIGEDYRPDSWIPHCPVAEEVPKARMAEAFNVLRDLKMPVTGYAMDIGLVEYPPVRELSSFVLGGSLLEQ